jgi:TolB-like protein/tetratricopeptide (TPR) repeat protein
MSGDSPHPQVGLLARLRRRGVIRVGASYAVIAWLLLQIGDVVLDPFDFGESAMRVLLIVVALGFPVAITLAWLYELTPTGVERDRQQPGEPRPVVGGLRRYADLTVIGVLVVVVAVLLADRGGMIGEVPTQPVVAVLPFANMSPEAEDAYFGEGVADTLIHKLGQLDDLVVLASQSTFQFKGQDLDLGDVGAKLGATTIMTGSVQRSGNALRVNARLVDVNSGRQLWGDSFDRQIHDVFAIQDEIAAAAVDAMHVVLAGQSRKMITENSTTNLSAYDAYVLGKARLASRTPQDIEAAPGYFRTAVERDPDYALAYAGLTEALYLQAAREVDPDRLESIHEEARAAAHEATRLAPGLGDAWLARALSAIIVRDSLGSLEVPDSDVISMFEQAIEHSPNNAMAYKYYSNFCSDIRPVGGCEETEQFSMLMKAARLDPRSGIIKVNLAEILLGEGRDEEAERWLRESLTTQEPFWRPGNITLSIFQLERGKPVVVALRNQAYVKDRPAEYPSYYLWLTALMDLGAWEEVSEALELMMDRNGKTPMNFTTQGLPMSWDHWETIFKHRLARATGQWATAEVLAREQWAYYRENAALWPKLPYYMSEQAVATMARADINEGNPQRALARAEAAFPERSRNVERLAPDVLDPLWIRAALLKQVGQAQEADQLLRQYLAYLEAEELTDEFRRIGWSRFVALALIGERNAALEELDRIAGTPYQHRWYDLKTFSFDPDYAAIVGEARFVAIFDRIRARADSMREEYLSSQ